MFKRLFAALKGGGKSVAGPNPPQYVSWYRQPGLDKPIEYLAFMPPYDHGQYASAEGEWFYTLKLANAFRFDTNEEAKAKTPTYDGSHGIEGRSGVLIVRGNRA